MQKLATVTLNRIFCCGLPPSFMKFGRLQVGKLCSVLQHFFNLILHTNSLYSNKFALYFKHITLFLRVFWDLRDYGLNHCDAAVAYLFILCSKFIQISSSFIDVFSFIFRWKTLNFNWCRLEFESANILCI